jgi:hypothetical protein
MGGVGKAAWLSGQSCTMTPTSSYTTIAEVPGTFRNLVFEVYMSPSTSTEPVDFRLVQAMPRLEAQTSDINFKFPSTVYLQKTSSFTVNTTKGCYMFAAQVRMSTNSTDFATTVQAKWMGIT